METSCITTTGRMFWGESWEVCVFHQGGGTPPPMRVNSTGDPRGVSLSLSPSASLSSSSSSVFISSPPSLASWRSSGCSALLRERVLWLRSPLTSPPLPLPLLPLLPLLLLPLSPRTCRDCCVGARVWPLGRSPPDRKLSIRATMARACSSDAPLPPNGVGVSSLTMTPCRSSPLAPPPTLVRLAVEGGLRRSWGLPPISCIRPRTKGVRSCSGGAPLSPSW